MYILFPWLLNACTLRFSICCLHAPLLKDIHSYWLSSVLSLADRSHPLDWLTVHPLLHLHLGSAWFAMHDSQGGDTNKRVFIKNILEEGKGEKKEMSKMCYLSQPRGAKLEFSKLETSKM